MNNTKEIIETHLKKLKLNFNYECLNEDEYYTIYIGSIELNLLLEIDKNIPVVIQMGIKEDENSDDMTSEMYDNFNGLTNDEIISKIDEYIEVTRRIVKIKAKIENIFEKIEEIITDNEDLELRLLIENSYNKLDI